MRKLITKMAVGASLNPFVIGVYAAFLIAGNDGVAQERELTSPHQKIISQIQSRGFKKVAVLPRAIVQKLDLENNGGPQVVVKNTLGPVATLFASELNDELVNASDKGFEVVPEDAVLRAIAGKKLNEVDQDEFWDLIKAKTGAEAGVYETISDPGPEDGGKSGASTIGVKVQLVDIKKNEVVGSQSRTYDKTLSDAAYAGESFIVREWKGDELEATGLSRSPYFEVGIDGERKQYANLRGGLGHPLDRRDYPYGIAVVVNGNVRPTMEIDGNLYVPLSLGEKYQLHIWNTGAEKTVYAAVYIDGLNTIGQKRERPNDTDTNRTWWLRPTSRAATIEGWFNHDLDNNHRAKVNEFVVVGADKSLASTTLSPGEETFGAANGMITAIFYTYGTDGIRLTKSARLPPESTIGTGKGSAIDSRISEFETEKKLKGLMLSALTLYYRTPEQIAQLKEQLKEDGRLVAHQDREAESIESIPRPAESQVTRAEAQERGIDISSDADKSTDGAKEEPKKSETNKPKAESDKPKTVEKPKPKGLGVAPGSDKP